MEIKPRRRIWWKLIPPVFHGYQHFGKYKAIEFDVHWWGMERGIHFLEFSLSATWKSDHGGIRFMFVLLNFGVEWSCYDGRHWNEEANRYETDEEIAAEIAEYIRSLKD